jgi:hypothetical protein
MKFTYTPEGFNEAKEWAKQQIYNKEDNVTLWGFVSGTYNNSGDQLHFINTVYNNNN